MNNRLELISAELVKISKELETKPLGLNETVEEINSVLIKKVIPGLDEVADLLKECEKVCELRNRQDVIPTIRDIEEPINKAQKAIISIVRENLEDLDRALNN